MSEPGKASDTTAPTRRVWPFVAVAIAATATATAAVVFVASHSGGSEPKATSGERVVDLTATSYDQAEWGKYFPYQYERYQLTAQITPTQREPEWQPVSEAERTTTLARDPSITMTFPDTRESVTPSRLVEAPELKTLWAGYAFAKDYRHARGHEWMLTDQQQTLRVLALADGPSPQPGACLNCHSSLPRIVDALGDGTSQGTGLNAAGWAAMTNMPYTDLAAEHGGAMTAISCIDCHDPETRALRITRPALIEGMKALKASEGIENYDVNSDASHQEM
ncbi:MAG: ammonia-forming cytochrome c nitrite reductase subunit c552, partial [Cellulomonas sp.]|nr:ammonia-forming cytochrome c nitrite reductase subunit c552 [Cellulomonas sp.]